MAEHGAVAHAAHIWWASSACPGGGFLASAVVQGFVDAAGIGNPKDQTSGLPAKLGARARIARAPPGLEP
eukprot:10502513-Lingulodinium_polyedra.AAC.1